MLKPTAANIEKNAKRWSLSWQPHGRCDSFTKKAILAGAPSTSGVYGLYNFDCQVFIGESANIQEALLRHKSETDFQSRHLQPTGFTFETCAAELRKTKAAALIARFRPVLQIQAALTETCSPSNGVHEREKRPKIFNRTRRSAFAAIFVAGAVPVFFLGIPAVKDIQNQVYSADRKPLAQIPVMQSLASNRAEIGLRPRDESSINTAGGLANESTEPTPTESDAHASASNPNGAKSAPVADRADVQALLEPTKTSPHLSKKWSVQISAAPAKDIADTLAHRLNANGFD